MTPAQLATWREKNGYSQQRLADVLAVDVMTVSRWERGVSQIPPFLHLALECVEKKGGEKAKAKGEKSTKYPVQEERVYVGEAKPSYPAGRKRKRKGGT